MAHPGSYDTSTGVGKSVAYLEDNDDYSIVSYNDGLAPIGSIGLMIDDIASLQKLYGANYNTRSDDTVYGFNSNTADSQFHIASGKEKLPVPFTIWDGGGTDTLDFSGFSQDQRIDLNDGALSDVGGMKDSVGIARSSFVENVISGSGNDTIIGNNEANNIQAGAGDDIIYGAGGEDQLQGGEGSDTFVFREVSDSFASSPDSIMDFTSGKDKIDVSDILTTIGGDITLSFSESFTGQVGESVLSFDPSTQKGYLAIDLTGLGMADFQVNLIGQAVSSDIIA